MISLFIKISSRAFLILLSLILFSQLFILFVLIKLSLILSKAKNLCIFLSLFLLNKISFIKSVNLCKIFFSEKLSDISFKLLFKELFALYVHNRDFEKYRIPLISLILKIFLIFFVIITVESTNFFDILILVIKNNIKLVKLNLNSKINNVIYK